MTSHLQDGGHDVISRRNVPLPAESTRNVLLATMQQRRQFLIYSTFVRVLQRPEGFF